MKKLSVVYLIVQKELNDQAKKPVTLDSLKNLGYPVSGSKFSLTGENGRITYTLHELADESNEHRAVPFCYAYDYVNRQGVVMKKPYQHYAGMVES